MTATPEPTGQQSKCVHMDFGVHADVARLTEVDGGPVVGYCVDVKVECADCGEPFCWRGVPLGVSQLAPTVSVDGTVLTAPIHPMSDPTTGIGLIGFRVTTYEGEAS